MATDIKHSRRLLLVGAPDCGAIDVVQELTGTAPPPDTTGSYAGATHEYEIKTQYYRALIPIWIDEIPSPSAWKTEFLRPEAREVVQAVGGWVYCFRLPRNGEVSAEIEEGLGAIQAVVEEHAGFDGESVLLAVGMPTASAPRGAVSGKLKAEQKEQWEDTCIQFGFEFVEFGATGANEFGEKQGFARLKEALEANEWEDAGADSDLLNDNDDEDGEDDLTNLNLTSNRTSKPSILSQENDDYDNDNDNDDDGFGAFAHEEAEMTAELFGMKAALMNSDNDEHNFDPSPPEEVEEEEKAQVENLDYMMGKLLAVKEQSAGLPEAQRKRMAAKAVKELLGE